MCVAGITRSKDGTVSSTSRDRCAAAAGKHRHRPDHSQATSEEHRAHRLRRPPLLGLALSWRWNAPARLRAQPGALPFRSDTDQIIPKHHLKSIERTGFGAHLFSGWRFHGDGTPRHDFVLNQEHYRSASILVAGKNFGCGSSREHAAWALSEFGFRAIIAPSYADIFRTNAGNNGLLLIEMEEPLVRRIAESAQTQRPYELPIDLETQTIADDFGLSESFAVEAFRRHRLLHGDRKSTRLNSSHLGI